jgi:FkbM family methyltransferase
MKPREFLFFRKLPAALKRHAARYVWRKLFGRTRTVQQTGANRLLRFLAASDSIVTDSNDQRICLQVRLFSKNISVEARSYPSSDLGILFQVLGKEEYRPVVDLVKKLGLQQPLRIIDAGANVGYATLYFCAAFPDAIVAAMEIDSNNAQQLSKQIMANGHTKVHVLRNALWSRDANLQIKRDFRDQSECSFYVEEIVDASDVVGYSIATVCAKMGWDSIDILKIDVEGGERYLFATDALADELLRSTRILAIEIHDEFKIRPAIFRHLQRNGFSHFDHGDLTIAYK